jgi:light-regulated signal transduction histidine kinase (bacteriophytochrome)
MRGWRSPDELPMQLRLAATMGYTQAIEDELRERYRTFRHDLRNPLGMIKSAIALLTDESVPAEMRENPRVRAMVVRNASSLDQMIGEGLGDAAARLPAFETSRETPGDGPADPSTESATSAREQRDDVARARQRPDLKSGAF